MSYSQDCSHTEHILCVFGNELTSILIQSLIMCFKAVDQVDLFTYDVM